MPFWTWLQNVAAYASGPVQHAVSDVLTTLDGDDCCRSNSPEELIEHCQSVHGFDGWAMKALRELEWMWAERPVPGEPKRTVTRSHR
jgi:hypothetical protein